MSIYARLRVLLALSVHQEFLEPYVRGRSDLERALSSARAGPGRERATARLLQTLTETAREWQAIAAIAVDQVDRRGPAALSLSSARDRKTLMAWPTS